MRFSTAFTWMKNGKRVCAPGFIGYWYWDDDKGEVIIVTKNNEHLPMKNSPNWDLSIGFINSDEWGLYDGHDDPRDNKPWGQHPKYL
jgi:hypothetical protein